MAQRLAHAAQTWTRPIRAARRRLELVLPPLGTPLHPVWLMLEALVPGMPVQSLDRMLAAGPSAPAICSLPHLVAAVAPVVHRPLPARRRWWQLPANVQIRRDKADSYTSLNLLLNDPHQWVLRYVAQLRPSDVLSVSDGSRLYGNLAHRLVELAYGGAGALTMDEPALQAWLDSAIPAVLGEEGAVLLMPGRRADQERFRVSMRRAFTSLREQLAAAGVTQATPEMPLEGSYEGGTICGSADLVLERADGAFAILDMKWSGGSWYPDLLANDGHLQLVMYAQLLRQPSRSWPTLAYFLLSTGRLVARTDDYFPQAEQVRGRRDESTGQLWQRFLASYRWRAGQVAAGRIEVVVEDIPATAESQPPAESLALQPQNGRYIDFVHLAGWEARP
jgi:RecB family exonuclease